MADGGGNPIDWKALSIDKGIDAILIPVGLFVALWVQGWVDDRKEKEDYAALIGDFTTEVSQNLTKVGALEKDLGAVAEIDPDKVLGPLQAKFDDFNADSEQLSAVFDCYDLMIDYSIKNPEILQETPEPEAPAPEAPAPEPEAPAPDAPEPDAPAPDAPAPDSPELAAATAELEAITACVKLLDEFDNKKAKRSPAVDLSPFYQYVVWQVYLSNGIKLFKDPQAKEIGLKLGEVYAAQREVEKRLGDIETLFNNTLMESSGQLAALVAESQDLTPDEPDVEDLKAAQPRVQEMSEEAYEIRYDIENIKLVVALKVTRLKEYVVRMNALLAEVHKMLTAETARVGTGK